MEQNNYLEFEKSKAAVYMIMEACFQDVFDLEDDELGRTSSDTTIKFSTQCLLWYDVRSI